MGRQFSHERRDCPVQGCSEHRWSAGTTRRDLGPIERATYGSPRPKVARDQYQRAHEANAASHEIAKLVDAVNQLARQGDQQRSKSKYDGRQVIEAGKKRRRELISKVARGGLNSL